MTYDLTEDQRSLREAARKFSYDYLFSLAAETERAGTQFPAEAIRKMGEMGLLGLDVPTEYGGQGFDTLTCGVILEEISSVWFSAASYSMTLATGPLLVAGTDEQKQRVLPGLCKGDIVTAFALSEPQGGSDAGMIQTFARRDGSDYVINGAKCFITNAHRADFIVAFIRTDKSAGRGKGISIFLLEKGTKGLTIGQRFRTLGHASNPIWEVVFDDCRVPASSRIGEENEGFSYLQRDFAKARAVYASKAVGVAQGAMDYALRYANERQVFGQSVASHQGNRFRIADIMTKIEAGRHLSYRACQICDEGKADGPVAASMAKHFATDVALEATSQAIQLLGGHGLLVDHPLERMFRDIKLFQIGDGSSEVLRILISRNANKLARDNQPARLA